MHVSPAKPAPAAPRPTQGGLRMKPMVKKKGRKKRNIIGGTAAGPSKRAKTRSDQSEEPKEPATLHPVRTATPARLSTPPPAEVDSFLDFTPVRLLRLAETEASDDEFERLALLKTEAEYRTCDESSVETNQAHGPTFKFIISTFTKPCKAIKMNRMSRWAVKTTKAAHLFVPGEAAQPPSDGSSFWSVSDLTADNDRCPQTYNHYLAGDATPRPGVNATGPPTLRSIVTRKIQLADESMILMQAQEYRMGSIRKRGMEMEDNGYWGDVK